MSNQNQPSLRLNQFLSKAGAAESRRKGDTLIQKGLVKVNGKDAREHSVKITPQDIVTLRGNIIPYPEDKRVLIMINKPKGYITTASDTHSRNTVFDLLPTSLRSSVHPIGRLDKNTTGLLLFTNDGDLTYQLTHPSFEHEKEYELTIRGPLSKQHQRLFEQGMKLDDGPTAPAKISTIETIQTKELNRPEHARQATRFRLIITEGRKRQIRRMCKALNIHLIHLHRVRMGKYTLKSLKQGRWSAV